MEKATYEVIDDNLISRLSIRKGQGFLALIDGEIAPASNPEEPKKPMSEDITRYITGLLSNNKPIEHKIDISEEEIKAYKEKYPDDEFVIGGCIFESLK